MNLQTMANNARREAAILAPFLFRHKHVTHFRPVTVNAPLVIDLLTALWLGFVGACIGSFLNVVAYRMPLGISVVWKPSHCPKCSHPIRAHDNVPVLGWLWLRGRCRDCGEPISPRYMIVEALMGLAFFVFAYVELFSGGANLPGGPILQYKGAVDNVWNPNWPVLGVYFYHVTLLSLLMCVALIDGDRQRVPRTLVVFGVLVGIIPAALFPQMQPIFFHPTPSTWSHLSGLLGAGLGLALGIVGAKLIAMMRRRPSSSAAWNLAIGFTFLGAFFGWQGMITMGAVGLTAGIFALLRPSHVHPTAMEILGLLAPIHLLFWNRLVEVLFR